MHEPSDVIAAIANVFAMRRGGWCRGGPRRLVLILALLWPVFAALAGSAAAQDKPEWLNQVEWDFVTAQKSITIAPDPTFPPIEEIDANGNYRGIAADYVHLLESKLGMRFSVANLGTWDAVLEAVKARRVDLLPAAANTSKRQEFLLFASPHLVLPGAIIVRNDVRGDLRLEDLYGKKVAIVSGYVWQELIQSDHPAIEVVPVQNLVTALQMASLGSVDAVIETLPVAFDVIHKARISNLRVGGETGFFTHLSFATRKDWPLLSSVIEKTLAQVTPEERRMIYSKWIMANPEQRAAFPWQTFWRFATVIAVVAALLALGGMAWIRSLRHSGQDAYRDARPPGRGGCARARNGFATSPRRRPIGSGKWTTILRMSYVSPNFTTVTGIEASDIVGKGRDSLIKSVCGDVSLEAHKTSVAAATSVSRLSIRGRSCRPPAAVRFDKRQAGLRPPRQVSRLSRHRQRHHRTSSAPGRGRRRGSARAPGAEDGNDRPDDRRHRP